MCINPNDAVILEWLYTPVDFFEEPISIQENDCDIHIESGRATAILTPCRYEKGRETRDELHELVEGYFRAVQVVTHKGYDLPKPGMSRVHPDGRRDVTAFPATLHDSVRVSDCVDIRITKADGTVVADTKRERIDAEKKLGEAIGRLRSTDPLLGKLLDSFQAAVNDPDNELVHLYEIRDALSAHFGGGKFAQEALSISSGQWKRLGVLANSAPVQQGRHRGKHQEPLREATSEELEQARAVAKSFIEAYVRYADAARS